MFLNLVNKALIIAGLFIVFLAVYAYYHRYEMIDCRPPYFLYQAAIGGTKESRYIVAGIESTPFSELSNITIKIELPAGVEITKLNTLHQDIKFDRGYFQWNIKHINKHNSKSIAIPIEIYHDIQKPIVIEFWFDIKKEANCPGDDDGTYTNKIYIHNLSNKNLSSEIKHEEWRLVR